MPINKNNPFKMVEMFEDEVATFTGAKYAVAIDSCTNAIFLCCKYLQIEDKEITIPKHTYLSVPQSIIHAGGKVVFEERDWKGLYQLKPFPIWDSAKRLCRDMYIPGQFMCISFHIKKQLPIGKGGMILCDDREAVEWFKRARYEGRGACNYHEDDITFLGWNMYMTPEDAARGLTLMQNYPDNLQDLDENNGYRDLTTFSVFKHCKVID